MKFDVVIGNPPYNNDLYIPFVEKGHQIADKCSVWITPAKWQAKGGEKNEAFRQNIVPYMSKIVYYPDNNIFDIELPEGISYYIIEKYQSQTEIINKCDVQEIFNNKSIRKLGAHLNNRAIGIINKVIASNKLEVCTSRTYWLTNNQCYNITNKKSTGSVSVYGTDKKANKMLYGYYDKSLISNNIQDINKYKVMMHFKTGFYYAMLDKDGMCIGIKPMHILMPNEICKDDFMILYVSDKLCEAQSFISYFDTKFIRFLTYLGCCGSNASNNETWRFVPDPGAFDHIFTDEELYKKYNLTEEEINIIESVIKERK